MGGASSGAPKTGATATHGAPPKPRGTPNAEFYREALPSDCPPTGAAPLPLPREVLRLIQNRPAVAADFDSGAKLGGKCPHTCTPCIWTACSVFIDPIKPEKITDLLNLPKMRKMKFAAVMKVDSKSGKADVTEATGHISLWMFKTFDPLAAITNYRPFP